MSLRLFQIPYDSGHRGRRMGAGPLHLVERGILNQLRTRDPDTRLIPVEAQSPFPTEIGTAFDLHRETAAAVSNAIRDGALPLVLSGNCNSSLGTVSGIQHAYPDDAVGVLWFDGHGDCNTPETFTGDFLDAMGLSTLTGRCWQALCATIPSYRALPDKHVILVGGHGMDEGARTVLNSSQITTIGPQQIREFGARDALQTALDALQRQGVSRIYLHLDVDVIDAAFAPANEFAPEGGLLPKEIIDIVAAVTEQFTVAAATVASYDPQWDREDRILQAATQFLMAIASTRSLEPN
ncbi:arginase family protein [Microvirga lenta]|uniref:arginase family protein n=1 Tax=Microvirga lenta TaxID=2881337 RepID=UPI001CFF437A|nr:arginase family protein [Microvirga lenta]MCB5173670.1 arginase family protein [Microvirga lenta]